MSKRRATAETTSEPQSIAGAVDEVLSNVQQAEQDDGLDFDPAKLEAMPATQELASDTPVRSNGHAAAVKQRKSVEHSKLSIPAGDLTVHLLDKGDNRAGIGIRVTMPEGRKLTEEEKEIVRNVIQEEKDGYPSGFKWRSEIGLWHKDIGGDSAPMRTTAIRLDAESRVKNLADDLREHQADPVGFAEMVQQRRKQAPQEAGIPD